MVSTWFSSSQMEGSLHSIFREIVENWLQIECESN
jgi:hypothetical protein